MSLPIVSGALRKASDLSVTTCLPSGSFGGNVSVTAGGFFAAWARAIVPVRPTAQKTTPDARVTHRADFKLRIVPHSLFVRLTSCRPLLECGGVQARLKDTGRCQRTRGSRRRSAWRAAQLTAIPG